MGIHDVDVVFDDDFINSDAGLTRRSRSPASTT